ncbi:MAG: hypothetical protein WC384_08470 [Prolixibacteraceae bacterium]|jgi:hypothetical protein
MKYILLIIVVAFSLSSCSKEQTDHNALRPAPVKWNFDNLDGLANDNPNMPDNYEINNGVLEIYTRPGTYDRIKFRSENKVYVQGKYSWRVFVPEMGVGDMSSIGCFLYSDDTHELDFEIGYGKDNVRKSLNATDDELVVYITSQGNPHHQLKTTVRRNQWYNLDIDLELKNGKYVATWYINNNAVTSSELDYGPIETKFYVFVSVENLTFIGDHIPVQRNYGLFDSVEYQYN